MCLDALHSYEDGCEEQVSHENCPEIDLRHVEFVAALRPIAKRENEAGDESGKIEPFKDDAENKTCSTKKVLTGERGGQDLENKEEVALGSKSRQHVYQWKKFDVTHDSEPREQHVDRVVDKLHVEHKLPED